MAWKLEEKMKYCKNCRKRTEHVREYHATEFGMGFFIVLLTILTAGIFLFVYFPYKILQTIFISSREWDCTECGKGTAPGIFR